MALIKMSSIGITNLSGKAGGTVYSRNRGGAYAKNFVIPSNTFSEFKQNVKTLFGIIASAWRQLSATQRNSWTEQAANYPRLNNLADSITLSGNALHQSLNGNLLNASLPAITNALPPEGTNTIALSADPITFDIGLTTQLSVSLNLAQSNEDPKNHYVVEATSPYSQSVSNVANKFRKLRSTAQSGGTIPPASSLTNVMLAAEPAGLYNAYIARFGTPAVGDKVSFRFRAINPRTGEVSAWYYKDSTVVNTD